MDLIKQLNECDTTYEFSKIYNLLKSLINTMSIKEIEEKCPKLTAYDIIDYLIRYGENDPNNLKAIKTYYSSLTIDHDKCLVIADTHIGRLSNLSTDCYENERGLYAAYNYALKNNFKHIIHLGDLLEGNSDSYQHKMNIDEQLKYLEKIYPRTNIKTYLLYGNHDYNLIYFNGISDKFYKVCPNMELIGINYSYINFGNYTIKLSHECKMSGLIKNIELPHEFELAGHSHYFNIYDRLVQVPSIASVTLDKDSVGFIEIKNEEKSFIFKFLDKSGNEVKEKEKRLSKKH